MQPFFGSDACEVADYKLSRLARFSPLGAERVFVARSLLITFQVDANRNDVHLALRNPEVAAHPLRVEIAHRKKAVHELDIRPNQFQSLASIRLAQSVDEQVFPLERAE